MTLPTPTQEYEQGILDAASELFNAIFSTDKKKLMPQIIVEFLMAYSKRDRWMPIGNTDDVRGPCLLFDPAEGKAFIGCFADWYYPEWVTEDGETLHITPTHYIPLPDAPKGGDK